jgi:hypothetical protein
LGYNACFIYRYPERQFGRGRPQSGCYQHPVAKPKAPGLWPEKNQIRLLAENCEWTHAAYPAEIALSISELDQFVGMATQEYAANGSDFLLSADVTARRR